MVVRNGGAGILSLCLLVSGCAQARPLDVGYHGSADGFTKALIAAQYWNDACGETLVVVHEGDGDVQLREQAGMPDGQYGETFKQHEVLGIVGPEEPYEIKFMGSSGALGIIAHEYGHALGIEGHSSGINIMNPAISGGYYRDWHEDAVDFGNDKSGHTLRPKLISAEDCRAVSQK
jgi:hypothetical protein